MLDREARLPGAPCLLARGTRLGGIAFYHVNGSCRAIPASWGEINLKNMGAQGEFFFYPKSVECKTTVLHTENRPLVARAIKKLKPADKTFLWWAILLVVLSDHSKDSQHSPQLCLNPTVQKDNQGVLGASFQVEQFSEIVGYFNMADYSKHIILRIANGKTLLINKTSMFLFAWHVKNNMYRVKQWIVWQMLYISLGLFPSTLWTVNLHTNTVAIDNLWLLIEASF